MKKLENFESEDVNFIETLSIKKGVVCDVYCYKNNTSKYLGIVAVDTGSKTPLQKVLRGDITMEKYLTGEAVLIVNTRKYQFPNKEFSGDEVKVEETIQLLEKTDLVFTEICHPPYKYGRYEDLNE